MHTLFIRTTTTDELIKHLREAHDEDINTYSHKFSTFNEFLDWKERHEDESLSSFVLQSSPKQRDNYIIYYYYCKRTGKFTSRGSGKRSLKQQGTSKLGGYCTAYIRAKEYECGKVETEICDHHVHEKKLVHLPLSDSTRKMIAAKLQDGVSVSSILDFIRENVEGQLGRRELITHQDVRNIGHQYNIEGIKFDADDAKSVSLWVQYFNSYCANDNPVLLYS